MGIYIPDVGKPKSCAECELWSNCFYPKAPKEIDNKVMPDCPLIEIVTCGECKYWVDDMSGNMWCEHAIGGLTEPTDFCSYGERRE